MEYTIFMHEKICMRKKMFPPSLVANTRKFEHMRGNYKGEVITHKAERDAVVMVGGVGV